MRVTQLRLLAALTFLAAGEVPVLAGGAMQSEKARFVIDEITTGLDVPLGFGPLPDTRMIVTEKPGRLRIIAKDGKVGPALRSIPMRAVKAGSSTSPSTSAVLGQSFGLSHLLRAGRGHHTTAALRGSSDDSLGARL